MECREGKVVGRGVEEEKGDNEMQKRQQNMQVWLEEVCTAKLLVGNCKKWRHQFYLYTQGMCVCV